jgi:hypothetical protein
MDSLTYDSLTHITELLTSENKRIDKAYNEAVMNQFDVEEADRIMDAIEPLEADYEKVA